jgi:hypothetical protein
VGCVVVMVEVWGRADSVAIATEDAGKRVGGGT